MSGASGANRVLNPISVPGYSRSTFEADRRGSGHGSGSRQRGPGSPRQGYVEGSAQPSSPGLFINRRLKHGPASPEPGPGSPRQPASMPQTCSRADPNLLNGRSAHASWADGGRAPAAVGWDTGVGAASGSGPASGRIGSLYDEGRPQLRSLRCRPQLPGAAGPRALALQAHRAPDPDSSPHSPRAAAPDANEALPMLPRLKLTPRSSLKSVPALSVSAPDGGGCGSSGGGGSTELDYAPSTKRRAAAADAGGEARSGASAPFKPPRLLGVGSPNPTTEGKGERAAWRRKGPPVSCLE